MKKIISIILVCIFTLSLTGCGLLFGRDYYEFSYSSGDEYSVGNTKVDNASSLKTSHISWYSGNITIETHKESSLIIEETTVGVNDDEHRVHYRYQPATSYGDVLFIEFGKSGVKDYDGMQKDLKITVPENDDYYIGVTSHSANVTINTSEYENTLEKLSITTKYGAVHAKIYNAGTVQIAGYNDDKGAPENRIYELTAIGSISSLGINSSYAKLIVKADRIYSIDHFGSVFNETHLTVNKAGTINALVTSSETHITVNEFSSINIKGREKPIYITVPKDSQFTLDITREKAYESEKDNVSEVVEIELDNVEKISDTKYVVGGGKKSIKITTYNAIYISSAK